MTAVEALVSRDLFGGAMAISLPARFRDMSEVIPVPDHQEVFAAGAQDQSLIVEINEYCAVDNGDVGQHYFLDLAALNEAVSSRLDSTEELGPGDVPSIPRWAYGCICSGSQCVARGESTAPVDTCCLAAVVRLPHVQSDVMVVLTTPGGPAASGAAPQQAVAARPDEVLLLLKAITRTLQIRDYSLFGSVSPGA